MSLSLISQTIKGERETFNLNNNWLFRFSHQVNNSAERRVDIPHTWNAQDALAGNPDYKRGIGNYRKSIFIRPEWEGRRVFLRFEGANTVSNLFVNGRHSGEHSGGYGAFVFEITDKVKYGKENELLVRVNNGEPLDIMPLVGDFNFYGGIYRDVNLIITDSLCISPLDYASPGLYLIQDSVNDKTAKVTARTALSNPTSKEQHATLRLQIKDGDKTIINETKDITVNISGNTEYEDIPFNIDNPRLWNGTSDPFIYEAVISLEKDGKTIDSVKQPLGLRYFTVDPDKGFFLNGRHYPLHGVCRHQERAEVGNALHPTHHDEDMRIMSDMGVNAIRLAHYPQSTYIYDLADKSGFVVWAEIPFVGPGGYADKGFVDQPSFRENGKEQLREMIRQHYNHPSICFWGLFNELKEYGDNPVEYIKELDAISKQEDPTRPTTSASNQDGDLNFITDLIAWNRYDGWYGATPASLASWLDATHTSHPGLKIAISEYGAGASIYHQQDTLTQTSPQSWWHPENWQTYYHIENWKIINDRPYVWGSFVWNMFDFGAAHRTEGDRPGINDKGLVTHDRKVKKDAYYFYKANWNPEPMVYIAGHRADIRQKPVTGIQVFSNCNEVTLRINGKKTAVQKPDKMNICLFKDIVLSPGENIIEAEARNGKNTLTDKCVWELRQALN